MDGVLGVVQDLVALWQQSPAVFLGMVAVLGLCVGSFLNVVIYRMPRMMQQDWEQQAFEVLHPDQPLPATEPITLSRPASTCPHCGHRIRWTENIPLVSWLALRGRCSQCHQPISWRYPLVELLTMAASVLVAIKFGVSWLTLFVLIFTWILIALTAIDFDTRLLPDRLTFPLLGLGLAINSASLLVTPSAAIWGTLLGFLSLWSVYIVFKLVTGKEGMGHGDFKLLAALGAWMGFIKLPLIILLSSVVGAIIGLILKYRHGESRPFAFGPFLAIAGWIALMWGDRIMQLYLGN